MPALAPALANRQRKTRQSTHEPGALNPEWNESWHLGEAAADVGETPQFVPMQKPERADSGRRWRLHCRPNGSLAMGFAGRTRRLPRTKCMRVVTFAEVAAFGGKGKSAERPCARSLVVRSGRADGAVEDCYIATNGERDACSSSAAVFLKSKQAPSCFWFRREVGLHSVKCCCPRWSSDDHGSLPKLSATAFWRLDHVFVHKRDHAAGDGRCAVDTVR
jgi:hypothetical protein